MAEDDDVVSGRKKLRKFEEEYTDQAANAENSIHNGEYSSISEITASTAVEIDYDALVQAMSAQGLSNASIVCPPCPPCPSCPTVDLSDLNGLVQKMQKMETGASSCPVCEKGAEAGTSCFDKEQGTLEKYCKTFDMLKRLHKLHEAYSDIEKQVNKAYALSQEELSRLKTNIQNEDDEFKKDYFEGMRAEFSEFIINNFLQNIDFRKILDTSKENLNNEISAITKLFSGKTCGEKACDEKMYDISEMKEHLCALKIPCEQKQCFDKSEVIQDTCAALLGEIFSHELIDCS